MTCGVARSSQNILRIDLAFCSECGSAELETCYTSKALGPHLCSICAKPKIECGTWMKETKTGVPMMGQHVAGAAAPR